MILATYPNYISKFFYKLCFNTHDFHMNIPCSWKKDHIEDKRHKAQQKISVSHFEP